MYGAGDAESAAPTQPASPAEAPGLLARVARSVRDFIRPPELVEAERAREPFDARDVQRRLADQGRRQITPGMVGAGPGVQVTPIEEIRPEDRSLVEEFAAGFEAGRRASLRGVGTTLTTLGAEGVGRELQRAGEPLENLRPRTPTGNRLADLLAETTFDVGSGVASTIPSLIGGAAGAAVGGPVGGLLGAAAPAGVQTFGGVKEEIEAEGVDPRTATTAAAVVTPFSAALEAIVPARVGRHLIREGASRAAGGIARQAARGFLREGITEAATEAGQTALERGAVAATTPQEFLSRETLGQVIRAARAGALTGGLLGGGSSAVGGIGPAITPADAYVAELTRLQRKYGDDLDGITREEARHLERLARRAEDETGASDETLGPVTEVREEAQTAGSPVSRFRRWLATRIDPELAREATTDPLTGALNRGADERATADALRERAPGTRTIRYRIDLDNFKALNDELGHAAGDEALRVVTQALRQQLRPDDVVSLGRPGGDEFAITMRIADDADPAAIRDRLEAAIDEALERAELAVVGDRRVGASIGYAEATPGMGAEELDRLADEAAIIRKAERGVSRPRESAAPNRGEAADVEAVTGAMDAVINMLPDPAELARIRYISSNSQEAAEATVAAIEAVPGLRQQIASQLERALGRSVRVYRAGDVVPDQIQSWTLDPNVARMFARYGDREIVQGEVDVRSVLFPGSATDRELVLRSRDVRNVSVMPAGRASAPEGAAPAPAESFAAPGVRTDEQSLIARKAERGISRPRILEPQRRTEKKELLGGPARRDPAGEQDRAGDLASARRSPGEPGGPSDVGSGHAGTQQRTSKIAREEPSITEGSAERSLRAFDREQAPDASVAGPTESFVAPREQRGERRKEADVEDGTGDLFGGALGDPARASEGSRGPIRLRGDEFGGDAVALPELRRRALDFARRELQGKTVTNETTGWEIEIPGRSLRKTFSHSARREHVQSIFGLREMLERGNLVESEPPRNPDRYPNVRAFHTLRVPVEIAGAAYTAKLTVREQTDGRYFYDHDLTRIEPAAPSDPLRSDPMPGVESPDAPGSTHNLAEDGGADNRPRDRGDPRTTPPPDPLMDPAETDQEFEQRRFSNRLAGRLESPEGRQGRPVSAPEIIQALEDATEAAGKRIRIRSGRSGSRGMPRSAAGAFWPRELVMRVREANNIPTSAHEVGHAIEALLYGWPEGGPWKKPLVDPQIQRELAALGRSLYGSRTPNGGYKREGWAEFMRIWITRTDLDGNAVDPAKRAPRVHRWFEDVFSKEFPEVRRALDRARELTDRYRSQGSVQRARAGIIDPASPRARVERAVRDVRRAGSAANWIDMAIPLAELSREASRSAGQTLAPTRDPYVTTTAMRMTHAARARYMVEEGMIDLAGNRVGPALMEIRQLVRGRREDFMIYLWARRTIAEYERGKRRPTGLSLEDARQIIRELETPQFELAAGKVYAWNDGVLNYAAQASPTFKAVVDRLREVDPGDYIPLQREFDEMDRAWGSMRGAGTRSPVKRFKGSGRRIKDPFQTMIARAETMVAQAHKRMVLDQILKIAQQPGMGELIVEVPRDRRPAYAATVQELIDRLNREVVFPQTGNLLAVTDAEGQQVDVRDLPEDLFEEVVTFFATIDTPPLSQEGQNPIVPIYDNGRVRWFEVPRDLYDTLASMDVYRLPRVLDLALGAPTRLFRAGTTGLRASFGLITNPLRDVQTFWVNTQSNASAPRLFFEWVRSMGEVALWRTTGYRTEWVDAYVRLGLEMTQRLGQDMPHTRRAARRLAQGTMVRTLDPRNWYDWFRDLVQTPEAAPRIAELRLVSQEIGWQPGEPMTLEQAMRLINAASQVTTDFRAAGRFARVINQMVPFHNAAIQGPRAHLRAYRRNPQRFVLRGLQMTLVSLLVWWKIKDEEWYEEMDARERFLYWHFPFENPWTGELEVARIPRAFEVGGVFAAMPEFLADAAYRQNPELMAEWFETFVETTAPPALALERIGGVPVLIPENPLIQTFFEQAANRDFFFDQPIVPRGQEDVPAPEQFNEYTSRVAIWLGEKFNASPRRIEHAIQGIFGPVSRDVIDVVGLGGAGVDRDRELADLPIVGRLFLRGGALGTRPKSVDRMYEVLEEAIKRQRSARDPETAVERQLRLQLTDAQRAVTALLQIRQYTPDSSRRRQITRFAATIAKEAVADYESGRLNREKFATLRRGVQTQRDETVRLVQLRRMREEGSSRRRLPGGKPPALAQPSDSTATRR